MGRPDRALTATRQAGSAAAPWDRVDDERSRRAEVTLVTSDWEHIVQRHPYIGVGPSILLNAVADPDARVAGRVEREAWFYVRRAGPSAWIRVVVHYKEDRGTIVTAFPRRSFP